MPCELYMLFSCSMTPSLPLGKGAGKQSQCDSCISSTQAHKLTECDNAAVNQQGSCTQTTSGLCEKMQKNNIDKIEEQH